MKYDQQRKRQRRPALHSSALSINADATAAISGSQTQNSTPFISSMTISPMTGLSSSRAQVSPAQKISIKSTHQIDIEKRINNWWSKNNDLDDTSCDRGKDYHLEIGRLAGDAFNCNLMCICGIRFTLTSLNSGLFKLSSFFRHMKEQHVVKTGGTVRSFRW